MRYYEWESNPIRKMTLEEEKGTQEISHSCVYTGERPCEDAKRGS